MKKWHVIALCLIGAIILGEGSLRLWHLLAAKNPAIYSQAVGAGSQMGPGGLGRPGFKGMMPDGYGGLVGWRNNSQGFRSDREVAARPAPGVTRVLILGDSFIAGYRVGQTQHFSSLLQQRLVRDGMKVEVLAATVEQPVTGLRYLQKHGMAFQPRAVILAITLGNDLAQTYVSLHERGAFRMSRANGMPLLAPRILQPGQQRIGFRHGLEKALAPADCHRSFSWLQKYLIHVSTIQRHSRLAQLFPTPPQPINSWYRDHHRVHLFDPLHGLGFFLRKPPPAVAQAYELFWQVLTAYKDYCRVRRVAFAVLIFPQRFQVQPGDWRQTVLRYHLRRSCYDLMRPNRLISEFCRKQGIACFDTTEGMRSVHRSQGIKLYLPQGDMHWNAAGHQAAHEAVVKSLLGWLHGLGRAGPG